MRHEKLLNANIDAWDAFMRELTQEPLRAANVRGETAPT
jgi:hypothetical protein